MLNYLKLGQISKQYKHRIETLDFIKPVALIITLYKNLPRELPSLWE
jgi:hypothetical protein